MPRKTAHEDDMIHPVEELFQIVVNHDFTAFPHECAAYPEGVMGTSPGAGPVA